MLHRRPGHYPLQSALLQPVSGASLAFFRIAFGAVVAWEVWRYWDADWIREYYAEPLVRLTYWGWEWVPVPSYGVLLVAMPVLAGVGIALAAGVLPRAMAALTAFGLGWWFLLEQGRYLNHFYLMVLLAALLALLPIGRAYALDRRVRTGLWRGAVPAWAVWAVRGQLALVYTYAAIAKVNADWLLRGEPLASWIADDIAATPFAFVLAWEPGWGLAFAWGGFLLDLLAAPLLLWRRTRVPMAAAVIGFHLFNARVFSIGVFPWLMIAATPIFFEPDWPERLIARLRRRPGLARAALLARLRQRPLAPLAAPSRALVVALAVFAGYQAIMPLRHWLYPGDVAWTEEGHTFSWRMKLRDKDPTVAAFQVRTPEGVETVYPRDVLTRWQASKVGTRPDLVLLFAHHLRDEALASGAEWAQVYAWVEAELNGHPPQLLVDPSVDLAAEPRSLAPKPWVLPLDRTGKGPRFADGGL